MFLTHRKNRFFEPNMDFNPHHSLKNKKKDTLKPVMTTVNQKMIPVLTPASNPDQDRERENQSLSKFDPVFLKKILPLDQNYPPFKQGTQNINLIKFVPDIPSLILVSS